ncbi:MAG: DUF4242 domain-containing protein [Rubrivivax sp.]
MPRFIVERTFDDPLEDAALQALMTRMGPCFEIYKVQWVRSNLSSDRKRMVCEYDAADAERALGARRGGRELERV